MSIVLSLGYEQRFEMRPSAELVTYAGLLELPTAELEHTVEQELAQNPALERVEHPVCPFCGGALSGGRCRTCPPRHFRSGEIDTYLEAEPPPGEGLLREIGPLFSRAERPVLAYLIGSLDDRGFLDTTIDEAALRLGVAGSVVHGVLELLQRHGPPGVGARDLRECLLLQLERLQARHPEHRLAEAIVADHLEQLAAGRTRAIATALGTSELEVGAALRFIRQHLTPFVTLAEPGRVAAAPLAVPDVIIRRREDEPDAFAVELVERSRCALRLAPAYAQVDPERIDPAQRAILAQQTRQARAFIARLERRWQTMIEVAEVIAARQRAFLLRGPRFLVPLTRAAVAAEIGVHESTVSRATARRYALAPSGRVLAFARFFDPAEPACAALGDLIAAESRPQSDAELSRELGRLGFPVARRTVAKYRDRLGIAPQACRRRELGFAVCRAGREV